MLTGAEITEEEQDDLKEDMSFFNIFLLVFAVIALFVGSFIIYNSFSILVAQRTKEMALMRAIGASRRQVLGSVLLEAVVVGLIASVARPGAGIGVAAGLQALLDGMGLDLPAGGVVLTSNAVIVSLVAGLGVSVASAVFPARRASKVPPIAAMRDVALDSSGSSRKRRVVVGPRPSPASAPLAMAAGLFGGGGIGLVGLGAPVVFVGVAVLGPVIAGPLSRVIGAPLPRLRGMTGTTRPGERHAQPEAHLGHRRGADDRRGPRRVHHHPGLVHQGLGRRGHRRRTSTATSWSTPGGIGHRWPQHRPGRPAGGRSPSSTR